MILTARQRARESILPFCRTFHNFPLPKSEIVRLLAGVNSPLVLEIGCNDGTDSRELFDLIPGIELHCFEPDPRPVDRFRAWAEGMLGYQSVYEGLGVWQPERRLTLHRIAIGAARGVRTLYMSGGKPRASDEREWDLSSSIRRPTGHFEMSPWCTFDNTTEVFALPLDEMWESLSRPTIDFIWADVQGGEGELIEGGKQALAHTRYMLSEFYEREMYEGQPNLAGIMAALGPAWKALACYENYNILLENTALQ